MQKHFLFIFFQIIILFSVDFFSVSILAENAGAFLQKGEIEATTPKNTIAKSEAKTFFESFVQGYLTYRSYQTFENLASTTPFWKKQMDLSVLEIKGEYHISPRSEVEFEIEFEHGGTGSSVEFDPLEEFGEFEAEVEKGGEVVLSEFYYNYQAAPNTHIKVGKIPVRQTLGNVQDNYLMYPGIYSSAAEPYMVPVDWREIGLQIHQQWDAVHLRAAIVNGLNSEFFRTYNWIGGGFQKRTETANAEDLAYHLSLQYGDLVRGDDGIGFAAYTGETSGNRFKRGKVNESGRVTLLTLMGIYHWGPWGLRGEHIEGSLSDSDKISSANATISGLANPGSFSPLGHRARLSMIELSYEGFKSEEKSLTGFVSYQLVDTMTDVEGSVNKDDRYKKLITSLGGMWRFEKVMFLKFEGVQYSTALAGLPDTHEYRFAFGFDLN